MSPKIDPLYSVQCDQCQSEIIWGVDSEALQMGIGLVAAHMQVCSGEFSVRYGWDQRPDGAYGMVVGYISDRQVNEILRIQREHMEGGPIEPIWLAPPSAPRPIGTTRERTLAIEHVLIRRMFADRITRAAYSQA